MAFIDFFIGIINGVVDWLFAIKIAGVPFFNIIIAFVFISFVISLLRG